MGQIGSTLGRRSVLLGLGAAVASSGAGAGPERPLQILAPLATSHVRLLLAIAQGAAASHAVAWPEPGGGRAVISDDVIIPPAWQPASLVEMAPMVVIARSDVPVVEAGELPDFLRRGGVRIAASTFMERHGAMALADAAATTLIGVAAPSGVVRAFVEDRADVACVTAADAIDPVRAGDVRALIVAGEETLPAVWDAPSAVDAGLPLFAAASWSGLYVTSEAVGWSAWLAQRHDDADVQRLLGESGQTPPPKAHRGAEAHAALLGATRERAEALARSTGLTFP